MARQRPDRGRKKDKEAAKKRMQAFARIRRKCLYGNVSSYSMDLKH